MSLYGAINIEDPKEKDYFGNAIAILKEQKAADMAAKEAQKKQRSDRTEKLLEVSGDGGFEAHQAVTDQRVKWLKENMESATDDAWFKMLNETLAFDDEAIEFKKDVLKKASELRGTVGVVGANTDLDRAGYYDDRSPEDIDAGIAALSQYGAFGDVIFGDEDGSSVLPTGLPLSATFDTGFLEPNLKEVPVKDPQAFGVAHDIPEGIEGDNIVAHLRDRILDNNKFRLNAIRWADSSKEFKGEDSDAIDDAVKIDRYAKAAAEYVVKPQKKEETAKKNRESNLETLLSGIQQNVEFVASDPGMAPKGASYRGLTDSRVSIKGLYGMDAIQGYDPEESYTVDGVYVDGEGLTYIKLSGGESGAVTVAADFDDPLFKEVNSKMTSKYGENALEKLVKEMSPP